MIGLGLDAVTTQVFSNVLGGFLQGDVDDARLVGTLAHPFDKASAFVLTAHRFHQQIEVWPVETGGHHVFRRDGEFRFHIRDHFRGRGGGQQQCLRDVELALVVRELEVVGAEVMAPLRDAVCLVHHQQRDRHLLQEVAKALVLQALHGNHQDLQFAGLGASHHITGVIAALSRIDTACRNAMALQECQLILHQGEQRRDHQCQVRQQHCRHLVTQGLA